MTGNGDHAAAPGQSGGDSRPGREAVTAYARVAAWPQLLDRLDLVRRQWDLAIIATCEMAASARPR
jgi:hypothetical protein